MHKIIVINAKGGSGKTTIATNLASLYAAHGYKTTLYDHDPQGSSSSWLQRRPDNMPEIHGISAHPRQGSASVTQSWRMRMPVDTQRVIVDTPAGVRPHEAVSYLRGVDTILVPVLASIIDVEASLLFVNDLQKVARANGITAQMVVVANRVKPRSPMSNMGELFADMGVPVVARLMDSVGYLKCAERGIGMHDLPSQRARSERRTLARLVAEVDTGFGHEMRANIGGKYDIASQAADSMRDMVFSLPQAAGRGFIPS
jgi:chromosome partitioning protein